LIQVKPARAIALWIEISLKSPDRDFTGGASLENAVADLERQMIVGALRRSGGNNASAAGLLDISGRALRYKITTLRVDASL